MKPPKLKVSDRVRFRAGALLALSFDVDEDEIGHVIEVFPPIDGRQRVTVKFARIRPPMF